MIKPLPGYVLIDPIEEETKRGDLYVPDTNKDKPSRGKVIEKGMFLGEEEGDSHLIWSNVKTNGIVVYKKFVNQEVQDGDKTYLLVHFNELLAIVE